jgi:site-specific DNA-methyltransferase (adenine-specific)
MIKLQRGDCLELLKTLDDNSVDLVVIDPPYIFDSCGGGGAFGTDNRKNMHEMFVSKADNLKFGFDFTILDEIERVLKLLNIYIFCNKNLLADLLQRYKEYNFDILVYHKTNPIPTVNNKYLSDLEYILFVREKGTKVFGNYKTKSKLFSQPQKKREFNHPTIKPLNIIQTLIENSSKEDDIVLDCFLGSGTTGVACVNSNRNFIGYELDPEYFKIAEARIENAQVKKDTILI